MDAPNAEIFVAPLTAFRRSDLAMAGGKAANLGELIAADFPVPPGFVVTTRAYARFVRQALGPGDAMPPTGPAMRAAIQGAEIPSELAEQMVAAYRALGEGPVAVRSSATAEDLPGAAFAGQQDTFLNVIGAPAVLEAVRNCWASLWSDRAVAYRRRQGIDSASVQIAVVVQRMVPARAAGVMFTANPVTGTRDEVIVDASAGLGEAVVSGLVTPDHFVLRPGRLGWRIAERRLGRREVVVVARESGGTEHLHPDEQNARAPALPDPALRELASLGNGIARHFGAPQDVEWAWADGRIHIVQARPMTALPPPPRKSHLPNVVVRIAAEMAPVRPYPLELTAWIPALIGAVAPMFRLLGLAERFDVFIEAEDGVALGLSGHLPIRPTPLVVLAPFRLAWAAWRWSPARWTEDPLVREAEAQARALEARDLPALGMGELFSTVDEGMRFPWRSAGVARRRYLPRAVLASVGLRLLLKLLGRRALWAALMLGAESKTTRANRALEALAARIRGDPFLSRAFAEHPATELLPILRADPAGEGFARELDAFLDAYGHRESVVSSLREPSWKDAPEIVIGMLQGLSRSAPRPQRTPAEWELARDAALAARPLRWGPLRWLFERWLQNARRLLAIREDTHLLATRALPILRRAFLEIGRRLAAAGALHSVDDVFHLTLDELKPLRETWPPSADGMGRLRAAVARRKERRHALEGTPFIPLSLPERTTPGDGELVRGSPGSPGEAEGTVRIVMDASQFGELRPGEVLVCPYTNPAWTPLFERAAAVVVDTGGAASHAAIVAREYRIPAVMGTVDGTRRLAAGQRVRVDGGRGVISRP